MNVNDRQIHNLAVVEEGVVLGEGVTVGPFAVIESGARLGDRCKVAPQALVTGFARIGSDCVISKGAVLGTPPQDLKFAGEETHLVVGDRTTIREFCTLNRGTAHGHGKTTVGSDCLLMAYSHVAHDCIVGDHVILANGVNMAGHVTIEDWASISGLTVIHQFVRIGRHSYIGGLSRVSQDVPPYVLVNGSPVEYYGPNVVGLRRRGFSADQIAAIKRAYGFIFNKALNLKQAVEAIRSEMEVTEEVRIILEFVERSERGISGK